MGLPLPYEDITEQTLGPHGGISANNLASILQMDNDSDFDDENEITFKLSHYYNDTTIKEFCINNNKMAYAIIKPRRADSDEFSNL